MEDNRAGASSSESLDELGRANERIHNLKCMLNDAIKQKRQAAAHSEALQQQLDFASPTGRGTNVLAELQRKLSRGDKRYKDLQAEHTDMQVKVDHLITENKSLRAKLQVHGCSECKSKFGLSGLKVR